MTLELWAGGVPPDVHGRVTRTLRAMSRDAVMQRPFNWHRRYINEQLSALPRAILLLRQHKPGLVYCGDPVLAWHLKGTQRLHGTRVVFMNGMRLAPGWARAFDGVQLIAPHYREEAVRELGEQHVGRFFVSPHFADVNRFQPPTPGQRAAARKSLGLGEDAFVVLNIGPVGTVSGKRLDWLAREVAAIGADTVLLSVGGDEEGSEQVHDEAGRALGKRFMPMGGQPRDAMIKHLHAADVYALAALEEPFSIAILEAMACGLPVVHHPFPVTRWITGTGGCGVSMETHGEAAARLAQLASDPERRSRMGRCARLEVETRFSAPVVCEQLVRELTRIAQMPLQAGMEGRA